MSIDRFIALFVLGLLLALIAFPVAFFVSAGLGYVMSLAAVGIGIYIAIKKTEPYI